MNFNLANQKYWDSIYESYEPEILKKDHPIRQWLEIYFKKGNLDCFEIGCYPGQILSIFGELGYTLNGIDQTPFVKSKLPVWLISKGFRIGNIMKGNFLKYKTNEKFDVVCSFGFIEHFTNWEEVLMKQTMLVKKNGYLIVETPNFSGYLQRILHSVFDKENYLRHNISSMNPLKWKKLLEEKEFDILYYGCFGYFEFWTEIKRKNIFIKLILKILNLFLLILKKLPKDKKLYSPYCGLIALKR